MADIDNELDDVDPEFTGSAASTETADAAFDGALETLARRAGAALRLPPPDGGFGDIVRAGRRARTTRTAVRVAGAATVLVVLGAIVLRNVDDDPRPPVVPTPTTVPSPDSTTPGSTAPATSLAQPPDTSTATPITTVVPDDGVLTLDEVAQAALLTASDLGADWQVDPATPPFFLDSAVALTLEECEPFRTSVFDRVDRASVATRRWSSGASSVIEHVMVFPTAREAEYLWGQVNGYITGHAHRFCFGALAERLPESALVLDGFGTNVNGGTIGATGYKQSSVDDGEVRTRGSTGAAANLRRSRVVYVLEIVDPQATTVIDAAGQRVQAALDLGEPVDAAVAVPAPTEPIEPLLSIDAEGWSVGWTPDGSRLVGRSPGRLRIWNGTTGAVGADLEVSSDNGAISWDGGLVVDGTSVRDTSTGEVISELVGGPWFAVSNIDSTGTRVAAMREEGATYDVLDTRTGELVYSIEIDESTVVDTTGISQSNDGTLLMVRKDGLLSARDFLTGDVVAEATFDSGFSWASLSEDRTHWLVDTGSGWQRVNAATGQIEFEFDVPVGPEGQRPFIMFSDDEGLALANYGPSYPKIAVLDAATGTDLFHVEFPDDVDASRLLPGGRYVMVVNGGWATVYDVDRVEVVATLDVDVGSALRVIAQPGGGTRFLTQAEDGEVAIWDVSATG